MNKQEIIKELEDLIFAMEFDDVYHRQAYIEVIDNAIWYISECAERTTENDLF